MGGGGGGGAVVEGGGSAMSLIADAWMTAEGRFGQARGLTQPVHCQSA